MLVLEIEKIYPGKGDQEDYARASRELSWLELPARIKQLDKLFSFGNVTAIVRFLGEYPFLVDVLQEAYGAIEQSFGQETQVELRVIADPEVPGGVQMFGYVLSGLAPKEAAERLQQFDRHWYLKQLPHVSGLLNFDILHPPRHEGVEPRARAVPNWIREWAKEFEKDGVTLEEAIEEARRISRKFKTPLSEDVISEREERR